MAKYKSSAGLAVGQGFVGFALVAAGVVGTLATVLGFFGSTWWLFDFAANFRAQLAVLLLIVALLYSLLFSKATGLFFMAMAIINGLVVLPLYMSSPSPAATTDQLTVVSFNVSQRASITDVTFRWVDSVGADVVVLLDTTDDWLRATELAAPYKAQNDLPLDRTYGITILAQHDMETEIIRTAQIADMIVRAEATIGTQPIVIYAIHSRSSSNESDAALREDYFDEVTRLAANETDPTIVVGDFSTTAWSHSFRSLVAEANLVNSQEGFGIQPTWPADRWAMMRLPFDHLVHSPELTTVDRYLGPVLGVEHRPIVVTVGLAG